METEDETHRSPARDYCNKSWRLSVLVWDCLRFKSAILMFQLGYCACVLPYLYRHASEGLTTRFRSRLDFSKDTPAGYHHKTYMLVMR